MDVGRSRAQRLMLSSTDLIVSRAPVHMLTSPATHPASPPQEQQQLMEALEDKETVLKDELVRQARHQRAFGEIRRLIDWATTPPSSMRSSL